jgi:hypothetical protein
LRVAVLSAGARALGSVIDAIGCGRRNDAVFCECGTRMQSRGLKSKPLLTILGPIDYRRSLFQCPACERVRYPGDEELDVENTSRSPGLRRMMARAGSKTTFREGRDDLKTYAGIEVSAKDVERVAERMGADMERWSAREREAVFAQPLPTRVEKTIPVLYISYDGTGVPMVLSALKGRKGKQPDGSAKTREVKLGCVFTQTTTDSNGFPVRDPASTSFVGAIEPAQEFGQRIYAEAVRRGVYRAQRVVVLGDGAEWIRNLAEEHFPGATLINDLYHAREHVSDLCKILFAPDDKKVLKYRMRWWTDLDNGNVEKIARQAHQANVSDDPQAMEKATKEIAYLRKNKARMRYAHFRSLGLFVGSGVVEAGCKTIIGFRLKQSGMEWSVRGANAIISLRCLTLSARFEDYWESRTA